MVRVHKQSRSMQSNGIFTRCIRCFTFQCLVLLKLHGSPTFLQAQALFYQMQRDTTRARMAADVEIKVTTVSVAFAVAFVEFIHPKTCHSLACLVCWFCMLFGVSFVLCWYIDTIWRQFYIIQTSKCRYPLSCVINIIWLLMPLFSRIIVIVRRFVESILTA